MSIEKLKSLTVNLVECQQFLEDVNKKIEPIVSKKKTENATINAGANRDNQSIPFDDNRVQLRGDSDYINASLVKFPDLSREFIVAQGPLSETRAQFWQMIIQTQCQYIIMITNLEEGTEPNCAPYFPCSLDDRISFRDEEIKVGLKKLESRGCYYVRHLLVTYRQNDFIVKQFHFLRWWSDGWTEPASVYMFIKHLWMERVLDSNGKGLIHCSDGSGRSMSFLLLEVTLTRMIKKKSADASILFDTLCELRQQRPNSVSSRTVLQQCTKLIKHVIDSLKAANFDIHRLNLSYSLQNPSVEELLRYRSTKMEQIYNYLVQEGRTEAQKHSTNEANRNADQNRNKSVIPFDNYIARDSTSYYNASKICPGLASKRSIIGQAPTRSNVRAFWRMIIQRKCYGIIMLNDCSTDKDDPLACHQYFPRNPGERMTFNNNLVVQLDTIHEGTYFDVRFLILSFDKNRISVKHLHYKNWRSGYGTDSAQLLNFIRTAWYEGLQQDFRKTAFIHSTCGGGRCGTFATIDYCLQYIVDNHNLREDLIVQSIRELQKFRAGLLESCDQLKFCYRTILLAWAALSESCFDLKMTNFLR